VGRRGHLSRSSVELSAFVGFRFPPEVIMLAVRWYLRFGLSYRDLEELLAERGVDVDRHVVPVGATFHAAAHRRSKTVSSRGRVALVRR
jgi:transposase-like protein